MGMTAPGAVAAATRHPATVRVWCRVPADDDARLRYWAERKGVDVGEYVAEAIDAQIRRENQDYDLPTLEIARLNQLVDEQKAVSTGLANLTQVVENGFQMLIGIARGESDLLDADGGDDE